MLGLQGWVPQRLEAAETENQTPFSRRQDPVWIPSQLCYCNAASRLAQPCRRQQKCQVSFVTPVYRVMLGKCASSILLQVLLERKRYEWEDKYKPRKPRFFNRVKTGFRVEQVQSDALRPRQSTTKDCTRTGLANWTTLGTSETCAVQMHICLSRSAVRLQIQHILPRLDRQEQGADIPH